MPFGWRVKAPRITTAIVWRRIEMIITPSRQGSHLRSEAFPPCPAESDSACTPNTLRKSPSLRRKRSSSSLQGSHEEPVPVQEELKETLLNHLKLTWRVLALMNRPYTTTLSSLKWTSICKRRITLYKLCQELRRTSSSDSRLQSDSDPVYSVTSSPGQNYTCDPRHWRLSDTVDSSPSTSPQSGARSPPDLNLVEPLQAHPASTLPALTDQLCN
jgi:hypothetical protein